MPNDPEWPCESDARDAAAPDDIFYEKLADLVMARVRDRLPPPEPPAPAAPPAPLAREMRETVLLEHLSACRQAVADCLVLSRDGDQMSATRFEALGVAGRLMAVSLRLSAALDGNPSREVRQSITVNHVEAGRGEGWRKRRKQFVVAAPKAKP